jgi:hypothetical protein
VCVLLVACACCRTVYVLRFMLYSPTPPPPPPPTVAHSAYRAALHCARGQGETSGGIARACVCVLCVVCLHVSFTQSLTCVAQVIEGLGTTIDVILVDGVLREVRVCTFLLYVCACVCAHV